MPRAGGPVIQEDKGARRLAMIVGLAVVGLLALGGVRVAPDVGDWLGGQFESGSDDGVDSDDAAASPATTSRGEEQSEPSEPPAPVDLMSTDPRPALDAFAVIYGAAPLRVLDVTLYTDYAFASVQVPGEATYIDRYLWRGGELDGPDPVRQSGVDASVLEARLFQLSELDPAAIPGMAQQALAACPGEGFEVTHMIIERIDQHLGIRVYVSNPVRGGGGYVIFSPDGALVEPSCS